MIDFYDIEFGFALDPQVNRSIGGHGKPTAPRRTMTLRIFNKTWMAQQKAKIGPDSFRIQVCPAKVLGHWNCLGSNDLREVISLTAARVLTQMGHNVTPDNEREILEGAYRVHEVHIAESFYLVNYSQEEFIRLLGYAMGESHQIEWAHRGTGFVIKPQNRRVSAYLYAKLQEFLTKALPRYQHALESGRYPARSYRRIGFIANKHQHLLAASVGPRLELRFGDQFFRENELRKGAMWRPETARRIYLDELRKLQLPQRIAPMWKRSEAEQAFKGHPAYFATLRLWHHGESYESLGSQSTRARHRAAIREALGIDIKQPSAKLLGARMEVAVSPIFNADNMVVGPFDLDEGENQELLYIVMQRQTEMNTPVANA